MGCSHGDGLKSGDVFEKSCNTLSTPSVCNAETFPPFETKICKWNISGVPNVPNTTNCSMSETGCDELGCCCRDTCEEVNGFCLKQCVKNETECGDFCKTLGITGVECTNTCNSTLTFCQTAAGQANRETWPSPCASFYN